ncbi:MAG: RluA family pseudouridine synthase [Candidatus Uhrbacteria bacterium]
MLIDLKILYEDNHCLAVVKPHGLLTQGDQTGDPSLMDEVKDFIKEREKKPGNVFLGLVHRLDRPVGGIVLFAKTSKGASRLSEQFASREVEKKYLALVEGEPKIKKGVIIQYLKKDHQTNIVEAFDEPVVGAQRAELVYRVLEIKQQTKPLDGTRGRETFSLIEVEPRTGRSHQIRVAMASLGTPIVGDKKYGSHIPRGGRISLSAVELSFFQPVTKERIVLKIEPDQREFEV